VSLLLLTPSLTLAVTSISSLDPSAHWTCDETDGVRYDSTANNNDLTDNNTVLSGTGLLNNACDFESTNSEYLSITDGSQTGLEPTTGDATWNFWVNYESDTDPIIIGKFATGQQSYWIQDTLNSAINFTNSAESGVNSTYDTATAQWYMLTFVKIGTSALCIWVNGANTQCFAGSSLSNTTSAFNIGRAEKYAGGNKLDALLDEITIDDTAWSTSTITDVYNSGTPLPYDAPASTSTATTSTSTVNMDDTNFLLGVIIFFLAFLWIGFIFSPIRRK